MPNVSLIDEQGKELRSFDIVSGSVLFNALEDQDYELPHGCLAGSCSACRVEIIEDVVESLAPMGPVETDTLKSYFKKNPHHQGKNIRLSCRVKVFKNIKIRPVK